MIYVIHLVEDDCDDAYYLSDVGEDEDTGNQYAIWSCLEEAIEFPSRESAEHYATQLTVVGQVEPLPC